MLLSQVEIKVNDHLYIKDPVSSDLGKRIVKGGISMVCDYGFEDFTFKKLATAIQSTEASIYRYFESKHKFLLYLSSWYWSWMDYQIAIGTANMGDASERLLKAIDIITRRHERTEEVFTHIPEDKLQMIVMSESSKSYHTRAVDEENQVGIYSSYNQLVDRLSDMILAVNSEYKYPHMIVSTLIEGVHNQRFFAEHLPRLTDAQQGGDAITTFFKDMVVKTIRPSKITTTNQFYEKLDNI